MGTFAIRAASTVAALAAGALASRLVTTGWRMVAGRDAPTDPTRPDEASWKEAMLYAALTGLAVGAARVAVERKATEYYVKSTGHLPPGKETDAEKESASKRRS